MTSILSVLTDYCAVYVDDINLQELSVTNPPLYAYRMWQYLRVALPKFNNPPEMEAYIYGTVSHPKLTEPIFMTTTYTTVADEEHDFEIQLGNQYVGFDLCNTRIRTVIDGNVYYTGLKSTYDKETARIVVSPTEPIPSGTEIEIDLYKDGYTENTLTPKMQEIIGICFQLVWTDRFNTNWLSNVSKAEDRSFFEQNRANKMRSDTERLTQIIQKLNSEMNSFSNGVAYNAVVKQNNRLPM